MTDNLPAILAQPAVKNFPAIVEVEVDLLAQARKLFDAEFYDHSLLDVWNAAISNLRRRVEAYGVDLFLSVVKDEPGRKKYNSEGEMLSERWSGVDDLTLIAGATNLGLLNKKAGKSLEMINWMRNHASPAHSSDHKVEKEDVIGLVLILQKNLFEAALPDPGHSVSGLFEPIKTEALGEDEIELLTDQINALKAADVKVAFGFMLDLLCKGEVPSVENVWELFPVVWERANDDLRKAAGLRYHGYKLKPESDESEDQGAAVRILDFLTEVSGIKYIPDGARASIYRRAAKTLASAKNTSYGWGAEQAAAKTLEQFGPHVPSIAFTEVYQEILAVWCGNYWGRSTAHTLLSGFLDKLNSKKIMELAGMFRENDRVRSELFQSRPKAKAIALLESFKGKVSIQAHKDELDEIIQEVDDL
ncbi:MAG: hypothetical protein R3E48_00395 [Burkholderiaceae bacterium]